MFGLTPYNKRNRGLINRPLDILDFDNFNNFVQSFFDNDFFPSALGNANQMKVDIKENEKEYILEAELPGVKKEDVNIELRDDRLTISVEKNEQIVEEKENYIRKERRYGSQSRSFYVENVKSEDVGAKFENGILSISLQKKEIKSSNSRKIDIN